MGDSFESHLKVKYYVEKLVAAAKAAHFEAYSRNAAPVAPGQQGAYNPGQYNSGAYNPGAYNSGAYNPAPSYGPGPQQYSGGNYAPNAPANIVLGPGGVPLDTPEVAAAKSAAAAAHQQASATGQQNYYG